MLTACRLWPSISPWNIWDLPWYVWVGMAAAVDDYVAHQKKGER